MNTHQNPQEARRRRLVNRSVAQHRELFFETIRGSTVNYSADPTRYGESVGAGGAAGSGSRTHRSDHRVAAAAPTRRSPRVQPGFQDLDDPRMTRTLQIGIVFTMAAIAYLFREPLGQALHSLFL